MRRIRLVPPICFLLAIVLQVALDRLLPGPEMLDASWRWLGLLLPVPALLLAATAAWALVRRRTTLNPFGTPSRLVTDGPFRYTRNPVYLALACLLLGVATGLGSLAAFLVVPAFARAITAGFIRREEQALSAAFGPAYAEYCRRVGRWL
ncbi:MAG: isoprenylcysteine carboxylmethyltransferase family protein [Gammaproteobacteria bacterium]|nr:isoprenylcysteine carboxylmethyltransferase family protein [Gammaproteobacteria bacterium]